MTAQANYPSIIVTVDIALFCLHEKRLHVVLVERDRAPHQGQLALPGGYVHQQEDPDALTAAVRVLRQKTGIVPPYLEQLYSFADGQRDERGWSVSLSYVALVEKVVLDRAREESPHAAKFTLVDVAELPELAFDHNRILKVALARLRDKSSYSTLPCFLLPMEFTMSELRETYEHVLGQELHQAAFRRKMLELEVLQESPNVRAGSHRPAQLFQLRQGASRGLTVLDRPL